MTETVTKRCQGMAVEINMLPLFYSAVGTHNTTGCDARARARTHTHTHTRLITWTLGLTTTPACHLQQTDGGALASDK